MMCVVASLLPAGLAAQEQNHAEAETTHLQVGRITDDADLARKDVERLRKKVVRVADRDAVHSVDAHLLQAASSPDCDADCEHHAALQSGADYLVSGEVESFAGSYILVLRLEELNTDETLAALKSKPLEGAAELLEGTERLTKHLLKKAGLLRKGVSTRTLRRPKSRARSSSRTHYGEQHPSHTHKGTRAFAHVFFWIGLDAVIGGTIALIATGDELVGGIVLGTGGLFCILGAVAGFSYQGRVVEYEKKHPNRTRYARLSPLVGPDFAGLGYLRTF
jgi:hypothetical protein